MSETRAQTRNASLWDRIRAWLMTLLPHHGLSAVMYRATRARQRWWKDQLIQRIRKAYDIPLDEAAVEDPKAYPSFNAFFTRALKPGARPLPQDPLSVVSPCDGTVSAAGRVEDGRILQAKGQSFTVRELLGDLPEAGQFLHGDFANLYLSPRDYHRVHMPMAGNLRVQSHIPGRLFSVAPWTVRSVPRLFARNERVVCIFEDDSKPDQGPWALVLVGAIFVSSMSTVWSGTITPPRGRKVHTIRYEAERPGVTLERGDEMGRFNMGSTVILLTPPGQLQDGFQLRNEQVVRMGEAIGHRE